VPLEDTEDLITRAADAAAASGHSFEQTAHALSTIIETGYVSRRMLRELGVSMKELAEVMGVAETEVERDFRLLNDAVQREDISAALDKVKGESTDMADTVIANWTRMKNEMIKLKETAWQVFGPIAYMFEKLGQSVLYAAQGIVLFSALVQAAWARLTGDAEKMKEAVRHLSDSFEAWKAYTDGVTKSTKEHGNTQKDTNDELERAGRFYAKHAADRDKQMRAELEAIELDKTRLEMQKALGAISPLEAIDKEITLTERRTAAEASALQAKLTYNKEKGRAEEIDRQLSAKLQEVQIKGTEEVAKLQAKRAEEEAKESRKMAAEELHAERAHATALLEQEKTGIEGLTHLHAIDAVERVRQLADLNDRQLEKDRMFAADEFMLEFRRTGNLQEATLHAHAAVEAATDQHNARLLALSNELSAHFKAMADDRIAAEMVALESTIAADNTALEARKRIAAEDLNAHRIPEFQKVDRKRGGWADLRQQTEGAAGEPRTGGSRYRQRGEEGHQDRGHPQEHPRS